MKRVPRVGYKLAFGCRNLEAVYLGSISGNANNDVWGLLSYCQKLKVFALHDAAVSFMHVLSSLSHAPPRLHHLSLVACGVTNDDCRAIARAMPHLRELTLDSVCMDDAGVRMVVQSQILNLEMLSLNNTAITDITMSVLAQPHVFPSLTMLCLWCSRHLSKEGVRRLQSSRTSLTVIRDEDEEPEECFVFVEVCRRAGVEMPDGFT
eukprot:49906_1